MITLAQFTRLPHELGSMGIGSWKLLIWALGLRAMRVRKFSLGTVIFVVAEHACRSVSIGSSATVHINGGIPA